MSTGTALWVSLLLLLGNAFFVGAEFALMAARRSQLEPLAEGGSAAARRCLDALEQVASLLVCAQLGITVCSLGLGALAEVALHHLFEGWLEAAHLSTAVAGPFALVLALLLVVYLHVVVGEMIPKNLAIAGPERSALVLVPILLAITRILRPIILVMERIAKAVVRATGIDPKDELASAYTAQEVGDIVAESHREGLLEAEQHGLVNGALEFSDRVAGEVAVPLAEVVSLPEASTPQDLERLVARHGFSRYLVRDAEGDIVWATCTSRTCCTPGTRTSTNPSPPSASGGSPRCGRPTRSRTSSPPCSGRDGTSRRCSTTATGSPAWSFSRTSWRSWWGRSATSPRRPSNGWPG